MQKQIAQAYRHGDRQAVYALQQRLIESEAARLLAVRRVAEESQGKDTAGVDGVKSLTPAERLAMAATIHLPTGNTSRLCQYDGSGFPSQAQASVVHLPFCP